ncbi:hypothetical protein ACHAWF_002847 [Thalassiosira exigua]
MPRDAYQDLHRCMHFTDDWEEEAGVEWDQAYTDPKFEPSPEVAKHRRKYDHVEDGFNRRWKDCVNFGRWMTGDESRKAGWYHSDKTMVPELKPTRTGATLHTICVTHGDLATYKLHVRVYRGSSDEDLSGTHQNTASTQKWNNLYDDMLDEFKGNGHCLTVDSTYMGDIFAQIAREGWLVNLVGTAQSNPTGADVTEAKNALVRGTYESKMFQHLTKPLVYALWGDNNIVKTLSNFHSPKILAAGNGAEKKYDLGGHSKTHNWTPKLVLRFVNMNFNNARKVYETLCKIHTPGKRRVDMPGGVAEVAHAHMQRGPSIFVFDSGSGRKVRSDAQGTIARNHTVQRRNRPSARLAQMLRANPWRRHQSTACAKWGRCSYAGCPGWQASNAKVKRSHDTFMTCEECSLEKGKTVYFCNNVQNGVASLLFYSTSTTWRPKNNLAGSLLMAASKQSQDGGLSRQKLVEWEMTGRSKTCLSM